LNLLYYISRDWRDEYGGNFEHSVNPVVVDKNRCCISNYYFSKACPEERDYYHVTSFVGRPRQPLKRLWGCVDNFMRQWIAVNLKISRGKSQARFST